MPFALEQGFGGKPVIFLESRRRKEMEDLILRHGGRPIGAPVLEEVPLESQEHLFTFFEAWRRGDFDCVLFLTGVGVENLWKALQKRYSTDEIRKVFESRFKLARGPKPARALNLLGAPAQLEVPEPNTWKEVLTCLENHNLLSGARLAVQEYGTTPVELYRAFVEKDVRVLYRVPVYQWKLPSELPFFPSLLELLQKERGFLLITSGVQIHNLLEAAERLHQKDLLQTALKSWKIASIGPVATQALREHGFEPLLEPSHPKMGFLVKETAEKAALFFPSSDFLSVPDSSQTFETALFLQALKKLPTPRPPVWIMRQAGRYLPSYRRLRAGLSFSAFCASPDLCAQAAVEAQQALQTDAAIVFWDLPLLLDALGFPVTYPEGKGPFLPHPLRSTREVEQLEPSRVAENLKSLSETVVRTRRSLPSDIPLIGFCGAPWTLAAYLLEGKSSRTFPKLWAFAASEEKAFRELLEKLAVACQAALELQIACGVQAVQLFDTWAGTVSAPFYRNFLAPSVQALLSAVRGKAPTIYFAAEAAHLLPEFARLRTDAISVDARANLQEASTLLSAFALQGNFPPQLLAAGDVQTVRKETQKMLQEIQGRPGYIANLGHGILPDTPLENVHAFLETIRSFPWDEKT